MAPRRKWILVGTIAAIFVGSGLGLHATRFHRHSPSSEARNTLAAIVRGVEASFEGKPRGFSDAGNIPGQRGKLCPSVSSVPEQVPRSGDLYQPVESDYAGWECLRFALTQRQRFRYSYHAGGGYLGPERGLPNPGPAGFEAAAEASCADGTGTVLFTRIGTVRADGSLKIEPTVYSTEEEPDECLVGDGGQR